MRHSENHPCSPHGYNQSERPVLPNGRSITTSEKPYATGSFGGAFLTLRINKEHLHVQMDVGRRIEDALAPKALRISHSGKTGKVPGRRKYQTLEDSDHGVQHIELCRHYRRKWVI
jgi:hypothetical protein